MTCQQKDPVRALRSLPLALVLILALPAAGGAQVATWSPVLIGSTGGLFADGTIDTPFRVEVDPADAQVVYVTTGQIPTPGEPPPPADGLWKSSDGGTTWSQINEPSTGDPVLDFYELTADTSVLDLAVCPADPMVLAAAANPKGFFKSLDGGTTWEWIAGGIVHTDAGSGHCSAIAHPDQMFDTVNERWAAATVAFAENDCDVLYGGVADVNAIDIGAGTGDHPGVFRSDDGGTTWSELNGGFGPLVDAIDCHSLTLKSKTVAPLDLITRSDGDVVLASTEQHADASVFSKTATSQLRVWLNPGGTGSWTEMSSGLSGSKVTQTASFGELTAVSVSAGFLSLPPSEAFVVASHFGIGTKILLSGDDTNAKSTGLWAGPGDLSGWIARDTGIPVVSDPDNVNSQNTGGVAINPANTSIWAVGVSDSDAAGADASQVYVTSNRGESWFNSNVALGGLSESPTGLTEANPLFTTWDAPGSCMYATVLWDLAGGTATVDDGLYKVCIF